MLRLSYVIAFVYTCSTVMSLAESAEKASTGLSSWLGKQTKTEVVKHPDTVGIESIELFVVDGDEIELSEESYVVVCEQGKIKNKLRKDIVCNSAKKYLWGRILMPKGIVVIFELDVAVNGGPLDGAIVHFRDGKIPTVDDKFVKVLECVYELPDNVDVEKRELKWNITRLVRM